MADGIPHTPSFRTRSGGKRLGTVALRQVDVRCSVDDEDTVMDVVVGWRRRTRVADHPPIVQDKGDNEMIRACYTRGTVWSTTLDPTRNLIVFTAVPFVSGRKHVTHARAYRRHIRRYVRTLYALAGVVRPGSATPAVLVPRYKRVRLCRSSVYVPVTGQFVFCARRTVGDEDWLKREWQMTFFSTSFFFVFLVSIGRLSPTQ